MHAKLIRHVFRLTVLASLCMEGVQSAEPPPPASSYTEEQIYTEPHNAAAAVIATANFYVGRLALECHEALGKPKTWVKEFARAWQQRNEQYLNAATLYSANFMSYLERTQGQGAKDAAMQELYTSVRGDGAGAVNDTLSNGDKAEQCLRAVEKIDAGLTDISPTYPLYKEILEIVAILQAFESPK